MEFLPCGRLTVTVNDCWCLIYFSVFCWLVAVETILGVFFKMHPFKTFTFLIVEEEYNQYSDVNLIFLWIVITFQCLSFWSWHPSICDFNRGFAMLDVNIWSILVIPEALMLNHAHSRNLYISVYKFMMICQKIILTQYLILM